jgi:lipid-binding SYLF domain-containing protein
VNSPRETARLTPPSQSLAALSAASRPLTLRVSRATTSLLPAPPQLGVYNSTLAADIVKATEILRRMTTAGAADSSVPREILARACGLALLRVAKVGMGVSARAGTGLLLARLGPDRRGEWSAPSAVSTVGVGWGMQLGASSTDLLLILNTPEAVSAFASGRVSLGGEVSVAAGPVGRGGGAAVSGASVAAAAPVFSYAHSKGLFFGLTLEGSVVLVRTDVNTAMYGRRVSERELLSGEVLPPPEAEPLYVALADACAGRGLVADAPAYER